VAVNSQTQQKAAAAPKERLPADRVVTVGPEYATGAALRDGAVDSPSPRFCCTAHRRPQPGRELGQRGSSGCRCRYQAAATCGRFWVRLT
jgi:hypothetical protein